ncbi:MAG TPA: hypothetical protein P5137_08440 [Candidatus Brocadiia bacterium]|nr:hypothetical protein [Candidatus Brocadiia bacterium]
MPKALALLSGGLDSALAAALILEQGIPVHGLTMVSLFTASRAEGGHLLAAIASARQLGVPITVINWSRPMLEILKNPQHGFGSNMNPCIDCRLAVLLQAKDWAPKLGCDFVVTGEVLGERPMSQRRQPMDMIQKRSGLGPLLLRPLSAQLLEPTLPETNGWVDRGRLLGIQGRCRKPQMELARRLNVTAFTTPAGGCLLTDPCFSSRLADLLRHDPAATLNDAHLLKVGRHLRLSPTQRLIVGRNDRENRVILSFARPGDTLIDAVGFPGPTTLLRGPADPAALGLAAAITARYGKASRQSKAAMSWRTVGGGSGVVSVTPALDADIQPLQITSELGRPRTS